MIDDENETGPNFQMKKINTLAIIVQNKSIQRW